MRGSLLLLVFVAAAAAIHIAPKLQAADKDMLEKQKNVFSLLEQMIQTLPNKELYNLGSTYDIENNFQKYEDPNIVKYLVQTFQLGHLQPKGVAFTSSVSELRKEVSLLTRTLLGAKDYQTFLKTAAWARIYLNEYQFIKAFSAAVLQRQDTQGILLPAPYEVFPHYYLDSRVIQQAQNIQIQGLQNPLNEKISTIPVDYTGWIPGPEADLSYFTQDIGLSSWYAYVGLAGWMLPSVPQQSSDSHQSPVTEGTYQHVGRGSQYYYLHQQLLARYHLERLSNGLGPIHEADYLNVHAPFSPHLSFPNGLEFPGRPFHLSLSPLNDDLIRTVWTLERRLRDAIDSGLVITPQGAFLSLYEPNGLDIIGDLIEGTGRSVNPRYYGSLQAAARQLLGGATLQQDQTPAVLELHQTAVRDPAFYQLYKRIIKIFKQYQDSLPSYQQEDLVLPGVLIESVTIDKLVTYFDKFTVGLQSATVLPLNEQQQKNLKVNAVLKRLNHKPFEYKIIVQSDKKVDNAVVRVYLGPKFDYLGKPITIRKDRLYFVELDQFIWDINSGKNIIERNSQQALGRSADYPSASKILEDIQEAISAQQPFYVTEPEQIFGFPERLALPKGTVQGLPLQLLVIISPPEQLVKTPYGPIVPPQFQTYQKKHFQIYQAEEYAQKYLQQSQTEPIQQYEIVHEISEQGKHPSSFQKYFGQNPHPEQKTSSQMETSMFPEIKEGMKYQGPKLSSWNKIGLGGNILQGQQTYKRSIREIIGGVFSLDGKPLGYPLERPLAPRALHIPNVKVVDVCVYHEEGVAWIHESL